MLATGSGLTRQRYAILALLLILAALSWAWLAWQAADMDMAMNAPTMGLRAPFFLAVWLVMMVAMMFPAAAPMILTFHRVQTARRERGDPFIATWIFVASYLLVWLASGVVAYAAAQGAESVAARAQLSPGTIGRIGGAIILAAGAWQLSPLKDTCLAKCRTPMGFIIGSWRDGTTGAIRMGGEHGLFCLGCCWLLFAVLFPIGIMNIGAMAAISALIFAEKAFPGGRRIARAAGVALVTYGIVVLAAPATLPTLAGMHGAEPAMRAM